MYVIFKCYTSQYIFIYLFKICMYCKYCLCGLFYFESNFIVNVNVIMQCVHIVPYMFIQSWKIKEASNHYTSEDPNIRSSYELWSLILRIFLHFQKQTKTQPITEYTVTHLHTHWATTIDSLAL